MTTPRLYSLLLAASLGAAPAWARKAKPKPAPAAAPQADDAEKPPMPASDAPAPTPAASPTPAPAPEGSAPATTPAPSGSPSWETMPPPPPPAEGAPVATVTTTTEPEKKDRGAFVAGVKVGPLIGNVFRTNVDDPNPTIACSSCRGLGTSFLVDVEVGYVLPYLKRSFGLLLDVGYSQPTTSSPEGGVRDPRVDANKNVYTWELTQRELMFGLTVLYRATFFLEGRIAPYIGIGPRLWLLQTRVEGQAGDGNPIAMHVEQSTKVGLGVPLGLDFEIIKPLRIFLEAQLFWAAIDHRSTGEASVGSIAIDAGLRLFL